MNQFKRRNYLKTYKQLYILVFVLISSTAVVAHDEFSQWYINDEMANLYEVIKEISSESLISNSSKTIVYDILRDYIYKVDEYGEYFTKEEYKAFQDSTLPNYAGVGIVLYQQKRDEDIISIFVNKSAKKANISKYDKLISVDNKPVKGENFYLVTSRIRGELNSFVKLQFQKKSGKIIDIKLKRTEQYIKSVNKIIRDDYVMLEIIRFTTETPYELLKELQKWPKNIPLIIDLRGNSGGNLYSAINSADLLLPKKTLIVSMQTKTEISHYYASKPDYTKGQNIILLQDNFTSSSAEVFIAGLTQNNKAQSIGIKSFGKGVAQKFIQLSHGDALLLTYAKIVTPNGKTYNKKGLSPTSNLSLEEFIEK